MPSAWIRPLQLLATGLMRRPFQGFTFSQTSQDDFIRPTRYDLGMMSIRRAILGAVVCAFGCSQFSDQEVTGKVPELDGGVAWLNTPSPIKLKDLRGKIVVLDFWTYCCINCIHTLPDLAAIERKYANEVVVIGVHSAKFDNEKNSDAIRKAIEKYQIKHPVVNDAEMVIWKRFGADAWPTLIVIDPEGFAIDRYAGEGNYNKLDRMIQELIKIHAARGTLKRAPLNAKPANDEIAKLPLYFPGKVLADDRSNRVLIADSTHNRIIVTDLNGNKIAIAGDGKPGRTDGSFDQAQFDDPQGMTLDGDLLYVADRQNHSIRGLDLNAGTVRTVVGSGFRSPWDLLRVDRTIYIAMAGAHQIWTLDIASGKAEPFFGSGFEGIKDGPGMTAEFAQPSGLATDGQQLFVADSESSSVRSIDLKTRTVRTLVGSPGRGLFKFGDLDGTGENAKLQHPLGLAFHDGLLYVADTYNSKIKVIDPSQRKCSTFLGPKDLHEPAGLSIAGGILYIADTSAHRIQVVDLKTKTARSLNMTNVSPPATPQGIAK